MAWLSQAINPDAVHIAAAVVLVYGLLPWEAWGLWRDKAWASWLGCLAAAVYLPFDLYALYHHPGWPRGGAGDQPGGGVGAGARPGQAARLTRRAATGFCAQPH